ncbi:cobalt ECF transporter T component CbiQ [Fusobacterium animalis]|uniref:cobalt ECF transporter T component CbiQ n=1 Tax=Fusobacterium TaxID=848 RepID=UPI0001B8F11E|nr:MULTISPECIES: cobalt ECF transporter T component CbiQ [Fusobacterium]EEW95380.1 cobalt ABC transporter, permease CbiQ [Fusobacterium animalis 3_1_33]ERT34963.1 cobalt ABC transporter, permease CbiQ [Fusobacterium nucleatum CTI-5]MCG6843959.1 cobalt ECF transporter T component CbiQ [Fusobacterium nucleatum]QYR64809.1 cobalt ECF transporter T component CbiQ [Fusobacterium animalis]
MISLDKVAYTSKLLKNNPSEKLLFSILTLFSCIFFNNILVSLIVLFIMYLSVTYLGGIENRLFFKLMSIPLIFLIIGVLTIIIVKLKPNQETLFKITIFSSEYGITSKTFMQGLTLMLKSLAAVSCLYFLILTTPVLDIFYCLEKLKLPKLLVEIISLVYRYIFLFIDVAQMIYISQDARLGYSTLKSSFNSSGRLVSSLFLTALKQANESFVCLEARCYTGELEFIDKSYISSKRNIVLILSINIVLIAIYFLTKGVV